MEGGQLFDDDEYRVEAMGEHPPLTREQFVSLCDSLHDAGDTALAHELTERFEDRPPSPVELLGYLSHEG